MASQVDTASSAGGTTAVPSLVTTTAETSASTLPPQSQAHSQADPNKPISSSSDPTKDPTSLASSPSAAADPTALDSATTLAARNAILAHLQNVGTSSLHPLSQRASDISSAHASITRQRENVDKDTLKLGKETAKLAKEAEKADDVLKDIGNVENWAAVLERDLDVLDETLRIVEEEGDPEMVDEHGNPVERKGKRRERDGWFGRLWAGSKVEG